jgi:hypothetical protein
MIATAATPSAGGAPLDQILVVSVFTAAVYALLIRVMPRERAGRPTLVGRAADAVARVDGGPRWFALPAAVSVLGALSGAAGVYWDVSYHISEGRDEGPLANPSHYLIFLGLIAIFAGGALALALADDRLPRRTLRITRGWRVPIGPAVGTGIALCALSGFPLDDLWHRLFGQDVTEWGPTHVLMIGGTVMLPYALLLTCAEAGQLGPSRSRRALEWVAMVVLAAGPVAFLLEYAYGVPQFPLVNDPVVITVAAVTMFVLALQRGTGWVLTLWLGYAGLQALLMGANAIVFDALVPVSPSLIGAAVAAAVLARFRRPTLGYGAAAGVVVALANLATEYLWTRAVRPIPWPVELLPWAALFCAVTGVGLGLALTWMHRRLAAVTAPTTRSTIPSTAPRTVAGAPAARTTPRGDRAGAAALLGALAVAAVFVVNVPPTVERHGSVDVTLGPVRDGRAVLDVRADPALATHAYWFEAMSWQGGGLVAGRLEEVAPGHYRTDRPMPVHGSWKTLIRLHTPLHSMVAAPVYLPADPAIPAAAVPAVDGARPLQPESEILRREEKPDVPAWLWTTGYVVVGAVFLALVGIVGAGYAATGSPLRGSLRTPRRVGSEVKRNPAESARR